MPETHFPGLAKFAREGYHYRDWMLSHFRARHGDIKWIGLRNSILLTWPSFVGLVKCDGEAPSFGVNNTYNPWMERLLKGFINEEHAVRQGDSVFRFIGLTGCGAASKTHIAGLFATIWWAALPDDSIAVLTSTTKDMIRSRVWSVIRHYATTARDLRTGEPIEFGHLIDSQMKLLPPSKDPKHSIAAYAVAHGETMKAVDNLKGLHAKRMLVIIDEANGTPEAIFNVIPNYRKACQDLTVIVIGNPVSRLDPHGRSLKPADGWSLTMDDKVIEWRTEGVPEWQIDPGLGMRFDGRDSPNVKVGWNKYPYLYTLDDWKKAEAQVVAGTTGLSYWAFERGMWPPEGLSNVIFTEQLFLRCDALGSYFDFELDRIDLAFLDVGFGSDACILHFGTMGRVGGKFCLQLTDYLDVPIDPTISQQDIDYLIARRVQQECIVRKIQPSSFGLDATGTGRGVGSILAAEWSPQIHYMQWGQGATERASAQNDGRPAREVYSTFVTELWFSVREGLEAGQIKGFSNVAVSQFCARQYEMSGKKYKAEPKDDMRQRVRYSPDVADSIAGIWEVARRNGLEIAGKIAVTAQKDWEQRGKEVGREYEAPQAHDGGGWAEEEIHDVKVEADEWASDNVYNGA